MTPKAPNGMTVDTREFSATLRDYLAYSRRDLAEIINNKGMMVAARATGYTKKADWGAMKGELSKSGLIYGIITNARKRAGESLPTREEWPALVHAFLTKRKRSIAFLRAGWIPAIKEFAAVLGKSRSARDFAWGKRKLGGAKPATPGFNVVAELFNAAIAEHDSGSGERALEKFAGQGLQEAMAAETANMRQYIERKMQQGIDRILRRGLR